MNLEHIQAAVAWHYRTNLELVKRIQAHGGSLEDVREMDMHFESVTQKDAEMLVVSLEALGVYNLRVARNKSPLAERFAKFGRLFRPNAVPVCAWGVDGQIETSVNRMIDHNFLEQLIRLAARYNSTFEGWGMAV
jgi:hypothetical protein